MRMNLATLSKMAAAGLLAVMTGCAGLGGAPAGPETVVQARANQRWQLLLAGKLDDAYQMLAPGYRAVKSADGYKGDLSPSVKWISAEILNISCQSAESCDAKVRLEVKPVLATGGTSRANIVTHFDEKWILVDGQWWHFPNR